VGRQTTHNNQRDAIDGFVSVTVHCKVVSCRQSLRERFPIRISETKKPKRRPPNIAEIARMKVSIKKALLLVKERKPFKIT
jgi:hypothetical protein